MFNAFITMIPGHAGRAELSNNPGKALAALSRPVAMIVPVYALFVCIMLCEFGFADSRVFKFFK
eukprot:976387-Amphidinium_carterae.1